MAADLIFPDWSIRSTYPEVTFSAGATWTKNQSDTSGHNTGPQFATTSTALDYVTIAPSMAFTDAVLFVYGGKDAGITNVYVDNVFQFAQDCYLYCDGTNSMKNAALIRLEGLTNTTHTIKLECSGNKSASSTGYTIGFNFIYVMDVNTPTVKVNSDRGKQPQSVLFAGDSITDTQSSYADAVIKGLLKNAYPSSRIRYNYATRAGGSTDYLRFIENEIIAKRPSVIVCMLGTNDIVSGVISASQSKANFQILIDLCAKYKIALILCTIPPRNGIAAFNVDNFNGIIKELAARNGLPVVDFNKVAFNNTPAVVSPFNSDGIHPDTIGHNSMGKGLFDVLIRNNGFRKMFFN